MNGGERIMMERKHKKLGITIIVIVAVVALLVCLVIQQTRNGVSVNNFSYLINDVEQLTLDDYIANCSDINDDKFLYLRYDNRFPSKDANDYREIAIYADINNTSFFNYNLYDSYISDSNNNSIICFAITNSFQEKVESVSNKEYVYIMSLFIYIGDKKSDDTDQYIKDNMNNWTIDTYFYNKLFKNNKYTYCLADEKIEQLSKNPYE